MSVPVIVLSPKKAIFRDGIYLPISTDCEGDLVEAKNKIDELLNDEKILEELRLLVQTISFSYEQTMSGYEITKTVADHA